MIRTFGEVASSAPEGFLPRRVHFPVLVKLDTPTKEGMIARTVFSSGFSTRELPLSVGYQPQTLHSDGAPAPVVGRLDAIKIEGMNVEGWGWILDSAVGREAYAGLVTESMRGNSIDMADVKVEVDFNFENMDDPINVNFVEANLAATTLVPVPAFNGARAALEAEIMASLEFEGDLEVVIEGIPDIKKIDRHLTAAQTIFFPHEAFTVEEPDVVTPVSISRDGRFVTGHLGSWEGCHTGILGECITIPRSRSNYAKYCYSKLETDKGAAYTGPILLLGGHKATRQIINDAMESMENVWANVTVTDGKLGPWMCGVVSPGITDEALHAARSGRISGHWLNGELYAVASVPVAGFTTERATSFQVELNEDNEVEYLAASFSMDCDCDPVPSVEERLASIEMALGIREVELSVPDFNPELLAVAVAAALVLGDDDDDA